MVDQDKPGRTFRVAAAKQSGRVNSVYVGLSFLACMLGAQSSMADLSDDAERLTVAWSRRGAQASRLAPVFVEHGQSKIVELFPKGIDESRPGCVTVALLGAPTIDFTAAPWAENEAVEVPVLPEGHPAVATEAKQVRSTVGVVTLSRCDKERRQLQRIAVNVRSPRAAIDVVVAQAIAAMSEPREDLPERVAGVVAPRGNPGRPIEPGPLAERVVRAEEHAKADGAQTFVRTSLSASAEGTGGTRLWLTEGCHRISIMATIPSTFPHRVTDVDAEARDDSGRVLATDRVETPDARLEFCLGESTRVGVVYAGASGAVPVMMTDAAWPMPSTIPNHWGARVRGGFALALRRRHVPAPPTGPVFESLGSSGPTLVPLSLEPQRCYVAAVSVLRGESRGIRMSATIGDRFVREDVVDRPEGASLVFCSEDQRSARMEVDVRGANTFWVFALFPLGGADP